MGLARRLTGHRHAAGSQDSGQITAPRSYELFSSAAFLGRRRQVFDRLAGLAGVTPGDRVLDIGCGTGYLARRSAVAAGPGGRVVGVDPSRPMVEYARRVSPGQCTFHVAGGERVPEPDGSFDVAVSSFAVHHIPADRRPAAFAEMFRLLRPGGRLLIADFRPPSGRIAGRLAGALAGHAMRHNNPAAELPGLIGGAGFTITGDGDLWPLLHYVQARR